MWRISIWFLLVPMFMCKLNNVKDGQINTWNQSTKSLILVWDLQRDTEFLVAFGKTTITQGERLRVIYMVQNYSRLCSCTYLKNLNLGIMVFHILRFSSTFVLNKTIYLYKNEILWRFVTKCKPLLQRINDQIEINPS